MFTILLAQTPVILMHGLQGTAAQMDAFQNWIKDNIPDTYTYSCPVGEGNAGSIFTGINEQIDDFAICVQNNKMVQNGFIALGYSYGGYVIRGYIHKYNTPKVTKFITMASPHGGIFCGLSTMCGGIPLPKILMDLAPVVMYSEFAQEICSVPGFWKDPFHNDLHEQGSTSLAYLDGVHYNETYRKNFESLQQLVMFGSHNDIVIVPWESSWYGQYKLGSDIEVENLWERKEAEKSGYKYLYDTGKVVMIESGMSHTGYFDEKWFKENVIEYIRD